MGSDGRTLFPVVWEGRNLFPCGLEWDDFVPHSVLGKNLCKRTSTIRTSRYIDLSNINNTCNSIVFDNVPYTSMFAAFAIHLIHKYKTKTSGINYLNNRAIKITSLK